MVRRRDGGDQLAAFLQGCGPDVSHAILRHNHINITIGRGDAVAVRDNPALTARCAGCQRQNRQSACRGSCCTKVVGLAANSAGLKRTAAVNGKL